MADRRFISLPQPKTNSIPGGLVWIDAARVDSVYQTSQNPEVCEIRCAGGDIYTIDMPPAEVVELIEKYLAGKA